jgi:hypothetical protein
VSRIAPTAEKIMAVAATYKALIDELDLIPPITYEPRGTPGVAYTATKGEMKVEFLIPPVVMASLIDAATRIAMGTDTRDLGILGGFTQNPPPEDEPLWGPDGPAVGQVITIAGTDQQTRWTGTHWEPV